MTEEFENFNDQDEEWLNELELRATDLENELFDWREARARELAETSYGRDGVPRRTRDARPGHAAGPAWASTAQPAQPGPAQPRPAPPRQAQPFDDEPGEAFHHAIEDEDVRSRTTT